ncbi:MAG: FtsX-like permease family protein [Lentimicrobium sp.]|jgi:ABC-type lipoprotein release transport system permease subunit|nr:FtsX-like permease family protein [Lentimicrobium sp.]
MKLAFRLAFKNLIKAGLRTWLNVTVLAFTFIFIIFYNGFINGWQNQAEEDSMNWEFGQGQLLNNDFDPQDPFTYMDGHGILAETEAQNLTPVLIRQATLYPDGRLMPVIIKGIKASQQNLKLPTHLLAESKAAIPALIGKRFALAANLEEGDQVLLRWRDKNGTFDAANVTIAGIFNTNPATVDNGQLWLPIGKLWQMTGLTNEASYFVANSGYENKALENWTFSDTEFLLSDLRAAVNMERATSAIIYLVLLGFALLAIFDTQVLSIFRRQREIGTYIALGMTRKQVLGLFTVEGAMYSLFAMVVGGLIGSPIFILTATRGISLFKGADELGITMANTIYPIFGFWLVSGTVILLLVSATLVSFLPARKIANMNPVNALKGKML